MSRITTVSGDLSDTYYLHEIQATYTGPELIYGNKVNRNYITVKGIWNDGTIKYLDNWILLEDTVHKINNGSLDIKYNECYTIVNIPVKEKEIIKFECHYHGEPVKINTKFDKADLHARVIYNDGEFKEIRSHEYKISDNIVFYLGNNNFYTATYEGFTDDFVVCGDSNNIVKDKEFKIYLIHDNTEEDVTDNYINIFYNEILDKIFVSVNSLNNNLESGKYRLFLPKDTGLNKKYSTEWIVLKDELNLKITPIRYFYKEEQ